MIDRLDHNKVIPDAMKALGQTHIYLSKTGLPQTLINLVFLRTSQINGCAYCIDMHARDLRAEGFSADKLMLVPVWREAGHLFDAREKAALAWTETVTNVATTHVPDEDYAAAAELFDEKDLGDLTIAVALMNAYNRIGVPFRLKPTAKA